MMTIIKESLLGFCDQHEIELSEDKDNCFFCHSVLNGTGTLLSHINIDEKQRSLQIETVLPIKVPENKKQKVAELIIRINVNQLIGNFDWDMGTNEICYKTSIVVGRGNLHHDMINHLFLSNWLATEKYLSAFSDVIFKNFAPTTALVIIDSDLAKSQIKNTDEEL